MFQYHNQYKILNKLLMKKQSGKILTLNARFGYPHLNKDNIRYNKKLNGGSFFDIACYLIKLTYLLLGNNYKNISGNFNFEKKYSVDISGSTLIDNNLTVSQNFIANNVTMNATNIKENATFDKDVNIQQNLTVEMDFIHNGKITQF